MDKQLEKAPLAASECATSCCALSKKTVETITTVVEDAIVKAEKTTKTASLIIEDNSNVISIEKEKVDKKVASPKKPKSIPIIEQSVRTTFF